MLRRIAHLPRRVLVLLVRGYQLILSPHIGGGCRFTPTCSNYAIDALERYGAVKGTILAAHRILRCNPWGGHGHDPPLWYSERGQTPSPESSEAHQSKP